MQFIHSVLTFNEILTVSLLSWFVAQVLKTIINFVLLGRFQLERMWGDGGMPSAHSATVTAMVIATARSEGIHSAIFAVAAVVAIITMHDAMGVRRETGEQAKVLNKMLEQWIEVTREKQSLPAEYAPERDGWSHSAAGYGRFCTGYTGRLPLSYGPLSAPFQNVRRT